MFLQSSPRRTVAFSFAMLAAFAALGETALHISGFSYPPAAERDVVWSPERDRELAEKRFYQRDERQIWKPVPGAEVPWARGEHLDASGFRSEAVPRERRPGFVRIAILGSDEALGVGLPRAQTWPAYLRQSIEAQGRRAEVLCAAVEESTLRQGLERWRADLRPFRPDLVLCTYAGEMESRAANCGCSDAQRIADNCGLGFPDPRERGSLLPAALRQARVVQSCAWLADILDGRYWSWRTGQLQEQRLRPAQDGFDVGGVRRVPWKEYLGLTTELRDELAQDGAKLILFPIAGEKALRGKSAAVRGYQTMLLDIALKLKIARLSALELFDKALAGGARVEDFYTDGRLNEGGQRFLARELGKVLLPRLSELGR
jgi:hypothetical protein